ncbi:MAG: hypothetical protein HONBIEJF_01508 [Fimbriimonadaceae bacterium]|nr:hypothetical protein [Fimbriimonadaceae bacterium]
MGTGLESTIRYDGRLLPGAGSGSWLLLPLPAEADSQPFSREETMIEGTIDGFPFRAPLGSDGIRISAAVQQAVGAQAGDQVVIEITRVGEEPEVRVPADFQRALDSASPKVQSLWHGITPLARREWVRWIASAKQEVTRAKRIEVGMDKLSKGMRRPCCFPGLNFVTKDLVPPEDTWVGLPGAKARKSA